MPDSKPEITPSTPKRTTRGILGGMRIRKKLIVLHTAFSMSLGVVLLIAIRPAMSKVILGAEQDLSEQLMTMMLESPHGATPQSPIVNAIMHDPDLAQITIADESNREFTDAIANIARQSPDTNIDLPSDGYAGGIVHWVSATDTFVIVRARSERARKTIQLVYTLVIATLLAGYALVAAALELFVLPEHVYRPLSEILKADHAVRENDRAHEIIPSEVIPADEIGSIMSSRNDSINALRAKEKDLAGALDRLEHTAADLHKKNHLLETARKNLEGADRLASLGMMSAGIAHELNTPLAVVKGLVEKLATDQSLSPPEIALLARVVGRLEKLSDGLLDFARVRPPMSADAHIHTLAEDATTLVTLDRQLKQHEIQIINTIDPDMVIACNPDRLVQVFVNLLRNAVDSLINSKRANGEICLSAEHETREGTPWVSIRVVDNGPGIDSDLIDRLFEPFVSTRLDSRGTGLGLAVTNGIVREHGGILIATNKSGDDANRGAVFEVLLPKRAITPDALPNPETTT